MLNSWWVGLRIDLFFCPFFGLTFPDLRAIFLAEERGIPRPDLLPADHGSAFFMDLKTD